MTGIKTLTAILAVATMAAAPAGAQSVAEFFKGRTITTVVGGSAGGSFSLNARVLSHHMQRHVPGNPTMIVQAMPGAGGAKAMSFMYNAASKDGTHMGAVLPPSILSPLFRKVKYRSEEFQWVGSITPMPTVTSVWYTHGIRTLDDAKKAPVIMATSSKLSVAYLVPAFINALVGTKFTFVQGYRGGAPMNNAMEKGEVMGRVNFYNSYVTLTPHWLRDKKVIHLAQHGPRIKELPGVPHILDLVKTAKQRRMAEMLETGPKVGHGFYLPPGVPADRVAALRAAFAATMKDPVYLKEAKDRNLIVNPVKAGDIQRLVEATLTMPKPIIEEFKTLVKLR